MCVDVCTCMRMYECEGEGQRREGLPLVCQVCVIEGRREESYLSTHSLCYVLCACFVSVCEGKS